MHVFHARREEAAGACGGVVDGADDARLGQGVVILHKDEGGGEAHDVTRGEVLPCGLVGAFRESADQLLEDEAHVVVGNRGRAEVDGPHLLHDLKEEIGVAQLADEFGELEMLEDLAGVPGEALHVRLDISRDARLAELGEIHL